jgi:hypothetical protein
MKLGPPPGKMFYPRSQRPIDRELTRRANTQLQSWRSDHQSHAPQRLVVMPETQQAKMDPAGSMNLDFP